MRRPLIHRRTVTTAAVTYLVSFAVVVYVNFGILDHFYRGDALIGLVDPGETARNIVANPMNVHVVEEHQLGKPLPAGQYDPVRNALDMGCRVGAEAAGRDEHAASCWTCSAPTNA